MSRLRPVLLPLLAALGNVDRTLASSLATGVVSINAPYVPHAVPHAPVWQPHAVQRAPVWQPPPLPEFMAELKKAWDRDNDDGLSEAHSKETDDKLSRTADKNSEGYRRKLRGGGRGGGGGGGGGGRSSGGGGRSSGRSGGGGRRSGGGGGSKARFFVAQTMPGMTGAGYVKRFCEQTKYMVCAAIVATATYEIIQLAVPPYLPKAYDWAGAQKGQAWYTLGSFPYVIKSADFGGPHGEPYDDTYKMPKDVREAKVQKITLYGQERLTGIEFHYDGSSIAHGSKHENLQKLSLSDDDFIVSATFSSCMENDHTRVCSAAFTSNRGMHISLGDITDDIVSYIAPVGFEIKALFGTEGARVDSVGMTAIKRQAVKG